MDVTKGAGARLMADFNRGDCQYDAASRAFLNKNGQAFFVTSEQRVMRFDTNSQLYNVFVAKKNDFVPCAGLHEGETVRELNQGELFHALVREQYWGDYLLEKGAAFSWGAGKALLWMGGTAVVGGALSPVVSRGVGKVLDKTALKAPSLPSGVGTAKGGVAQTTAALKATKQGLSENVQPHAAHVGLNAINGQIINPINPPLPNNPFCPVGRIPWRVPHIPRNVDPIGPCFVPPQLGGASFEWWQRGLFSGGSTATGAGLGFVVGGPVGSAIGGAIGAGIGNLF